MEFDTLYKYRSWKMPYHPASLAENQLYFTSPKAMNDPFDCKIPADFSLLDTDQKIYDYIDYSISKFTDAQIPVMGDLNKLRQDRYLIFKNNPKAVQHFFQTRYFDRIDNHFGVLCFSYVWDSVLMWSHYSDNHRGFCLGFEVSIIPDGIASGASGAVQYDSFPRIDPLMIDDIKMSIRQTFFKDPGWKYEKEFRVIKLEFPYALTSDQRKFIYPDRFLKEIILGLLIDEADKAAIIREGIKKGVPIYQVEKVPLSFELSRRQLTAEEFGKYQ